MVRNYKKIATHQMNYTEDDVARALLSIQEGMTIREAAEEYHIPKTTLHNRISGRSQSPKKKGRKPVLLKSEELALAEQLAILGDYGKAMDVEELKRYVKYYLDESGRSVSLFEDNIPGTEWVRGFMKRHQNMLTKRMCQNISRRRAAVSVTIVQEYFEKLKKTMDGVPAANIVNYDETNLTDDPKGKLQIFRRGCKYAERVMNTSKNSISIMFAITASGESLAPYVVYKGDRMQDSWMIGGPADARYNRTATGWFDSATFSDWFESVYMLYVRALPREQPKVLIGDNLPSHINFKIVESCEKNNIRMCFLPPYSTHLLQPLDVSVFAPLKKVWNKVLSEWKMAEGRYYSILPKQCFPKLLLSVMEKMNLKWEILAKAGFKTCGIYPYDPTPVINKVSKTPSKETANATRATNNATLIKYLQESNEKKIETKKKRGKHVKVPAGQSVSLNDLLAAGPSSRSEPIRAPPKKKLHFTTEKERNKDGNKCVNSEEYLPGDYVLVEYLPKIFYLGKLQSKKENGWEVEYYRHAEGSEKDVQNCVSFKLPINPDISITNENQFTQKCILLNIKKNKLVFKNTFEGKVVR